MTVPNVKLRHLVLGVCLAAASGPATAAEPGARPLTCAEDPQFRQQDFTLGTWDVYAGTIKAAQVRMERVLGGCAIHETWTQMGNRPGNGLGMFTYSRQLKSWHYLWAADNAAATSFNGSMIQPGEMHYAMTYPLAKGGARVRHWSLTLLPDGRVRELSLGSDDEGKTWVTEYDLTWVKVGE